jgi:hypothetical protein
VFPIKVIIAPPRADASYYCSHDDACHFGQNYKHWHCSVQAGSCSISADQ